MPAELLTAVLTGWDRHNEVLVNLLRAIPTDAFGARVMDGSSTMASMFSHRAGDLALLASPEWVTTRGDPSQGPALVAPVRACHARSRNRWRVTDCISLTSSDATASIWWPPTGVRNQRPRDQIRPVLTSPFTETCIQRECPDPAQLGAPAFGGLVQPKKAT